MAEVAVDECFGSVVVCYDAEWSVDVVNVGCELVYVYGCLEVGSSD